MVGRSKRLLLISSLSLLLVLVVGGIIYLILQNQPKFASQSSETEAVTLFYDALGNAAKQPILKVGMYRETYANKADADAKQNAGSIASSVSEADNQTNKFQAVFAHNFLNDNKTLTPGRCVNGIEYVPVYSGQAHAATLHQVVPYLALAPIGLLHSHSNPQSPDSPCLHVGINPAPTIIASARLSDGIMPVQLTDAQATKWVTEAKRAELFTIKDEGMVNKDGKELRKISVTPKNDHSVSQRLYDIFYSVADIATLKDNPKVLWQYQFISINPANSGSVGGYYLIDAKTKLPVYSELYGTNPDEKIGDSPGAGRNIARTKQSYDFEGQLIITTTTPLEFLN